MAEIYTAIGYHDHGKTELYRELLRHLRASGDRFEHARGERGMVMAVFTMPGFDVVFKVIRDRFPEPKSTTREKVMERYDLVFQHDRAGRLVDAQSFEHLSFDRERFAPELLEELLGGAGETVALTRDRVVIRQLYTERRMTPLNLYLREAEPEAARKAVLDYGQAIRDLAATGVFPGDVLPKNFGVTRHGRVIFYDYDELALVSECRFREMPAPEHAEDETRAEPWFYVADNDIFPEEFLSFLGLPGALREVFLDAHRDLLGVRFWRDMQERLRGGRDPRHPALSCGPAPARSGEVSWPSGAAVVPSGPPAERFLAASSPRIRRTKEACIMTYTHAKVPAAGGRVTIKDGKLQVPDQPIIPFIEGDGTGPDIWRASVRVLDAAVAEGLRRQAQDRLDGGLRGREGVRQVRHLAARRDGRRLPRVPGRHQGPADHAHRRRHPLAQRGAAPDARPLRLPAPGALVQGRPLAGASIPRRSTW